MNKKTVFFIFLIIVLAAFLRLYKIGEIPPSPDWDEAALGYNAYSILKTGKDEYGKVFPVILRSFDDYKPALYAYLIIPFIKVFDLNVVSVRLPSALFGTLTVLATYFLTIEFFKNFKVKSGGEASVIALLTSFLLAISPWHIQFSRIAFEANVAVFFNVSAVLFLMKGLKNPKFLLLGIILLALGIYTYQSEKVFVPFLAVAFLILFRERLIKIPKKYIFASLGIGFILSLPMFYNILFNKEALSRAQGVSIFSEKTLLLEQSVDRIIFDKENKDFIGLLFDNRRVVYFKSIFSGYISHFDLNWLFITGDIARHHAPGMGLLYLFELPFLFLGTYHLFFSNLDKKIKLFLFAWFLFAPIPASVTSGVPHAVRTLNFLPMFQIFSAIGFLIFLQSISNIKNKIKYLIFAFYFLFFIFNFLYYLNQYFVQQNYFNSEFWQYGYEEAISEVKRVNNRYTKIIVSNRPYLDQSYMFFLFYLKYNPFLYQKEVQNSSGGFKENHSFGKFEFRPINWEKEEKNDNYLYIGRPDDFPVGVKTVKDIHFLNKKPAIKIVEG